MGPGDVVYLYDDAGTYRESLQLSLKGISGQPIVIKAAPNETPVIRGSIVLTQAEYVSLEGLTITGSRYAGVIIKDKSNNITFTNCVIQNNMGGVWIGEGAGGSHKILHNNISSNSTHGIVVDKVNCTPGTETVLAFNQISTNKFHGIEINANYYIIEHNKVFGNGGGVHGTSGIHLFSQDAAENSGDFNIIRYNECFDNIDARKGPDGNGIQLDVYCDHNQIYYNICYNNDGAGISLFDSSESRVFNNTLYNNMKDPDNSHPFKAELYLASDSSKKMNRVRNVEVFNNIIVASRPHSYVIYVDEPTSNNQMSITNNLFFHTLGKDFYYWKNSSGRDVAAWNALKAGTGVNFYENPAFVSPNPAKLQDFMVQKTSVAVDRAKPQGQTRDILGAAVPKGKGPDIGAIECF